MDKLGEKCFVIARFLMLAHCRCTLLILHLVAASECVYVAVAVFRVIGEANRGELFRKRARRPLQAPKHPLVLHSVCECTSFLQMATATAADASLDAIPPPPPPSNPSYVYPSIFERLYF